MSDVGARKRGAGLWIGLGAAAALGLGVLYLHSGGAVQSMPAPAASALQAAATGEVAGFNARQPVADAPELSFADAEGKAHSLKEWRGKVLLLNIWATWCAPCRREMPALDALKAKKAGPDFDVVALSVDRGGFEKPRRFWTETGVKSLGLYVDSGSALSGLGIIGMPTTLLIGRDGRELGRLAGPAEWASPDADRLIETALAAK